MPASIAKLNASRTVAITVLGAVPRFSMSLMRLPLVPAPSAIPAATAKQQHKHDNDEKCCGIHVTLPQRKLFLSTTRKSSKEFRFPNVDQNISVPMKKLRLKKIGLSALTCRVTPSCSTGSQQRGAAL